MADTALSEATNNQINAAKQEIYDYVKIRLGDGMVEVELDPKHLENAFITAVDKFRQRSSNSAEELKLHANSFIQPSSFSSEQFVKINNDKLNLSNKINSREYTIKNLMRKLYINFKKSLLDFYKIRTFPKYGLSQNTDVPEIRTSKYGLNNKPNTDLHYVRADVVACPYIVKSKSVCCKL